MIFNCANPTCSAVLDLPTPQNRDELARALAAVGWVFGVQPGGMVWILQCARCHREFPEMVRAWSPDA